jgi:hypothetical protein
MADDNDNKKTLPEADGHDEVELGDAGTGAPGAAPSGHTRPEGTDADLHSAAERVAFSPSALVVSIVGQIIAGPQQVAATGRPLTPQERFQSFAGALLGTDKAPGLLAAVDFDGNVIALLERGGVGANLSPGIAVGLGLAAIVGLAFLHRAPKQRPGTPAATPVRPAPPPHDGGVA